MELQAMNSQDNHDAAHAGRSAAVDGGLLLTREELAELTGTRQAARQRRWLLDRRWPFLDALGRNTYPRVSRELVRQYLHGAAPAQVQSKRGEFNLAALEAKVAGRRSA
jgi:hypothetical protein